jgi:glucose-6-phosphate isomerase
MVGLAPMALCGWDWRGLLRGAALADAWTRAPAPQNPAARLAAAWYIAGNARGDRALVVEPYRDRLALLGRYLQQLVMESIGKRLNRQGNVVHQGLTVYGNKGSTDQHAFIQQVRDGRDDCFVHFITTTEQGPRIPVDGATFADDHLLGFQLGTAQALSEAGRPHVTINTTRLDVQGLGALVAIFERAVGLYAELVGINAYHQPGVEAGKRGAKVAVERLLRLLTHLDDQPRSAEELASLAGGDAKTIWRLLEHLHATGRATKIAGERPSQDLYQRPS